MVQRRAKSNFRFQAEDHTRQVLRWYKLRNFRVIPVHPVSRITVNFLTHIHFLVQKEKELEGIITVASVLNLPDPSRTSISVITPPKVLRP